MLEFGVVSRPADRHSGRRQRADGTTGAGRCEPVVAHRQWHRHWRITGRHGGRRGSDALYAFAIFLLSVRFDRRSLPTPRGERNPGRPRNRITRLALGFFPHDGEQRAGVDPARLPARERLAERCGDQFHGKERVRSGRRAGRAALPVRAALVVVAAQRVLQPPAQRRPPLLPASLDPAAAAGLRLVDRRQVRQRSLQQQRADIGDGARPRARCGSWQLRAALFPEWPGVEHLPVRRHQRAPRALEPAGVRRPVWRR